MDLYLNNNASKTRSPRALLRYCRTNCSAAMIPSLSPFLHLPAVGIQEHPVFQKCQLEAQESDLRFVLIPIFWTLD